MSRAKCAAGLVGNWIVGGDSVGRGGIDEVMGWENGV